MAVQTTQVSPTQQGRLLSAREGHFLDLKAKENAPPDSYVGAVPRTRPARRTDGA